ncbi:MULTISPECIES: ABC transporter ATP-binding protein [Sorangium]|uniref:Sugar ABC transporter ATP-binding protein n=1 Tax=Sorangium cellulosum TaxID=56 RepID=A0A4P2R6R9_SORCE|nr:MULTISPECIES: ABC transporter ATP-binding protein [Sorangium]AUX38528.1 sugar ABC transporter ATP-binding protein [Sorangium cellulosum]WCQ97814.1 Diacetylchitobiose uptake system ATP-binding protein MsiK [Sorangium sp. Soce836]
MATLSLRGLTRRFPGAERPALAGLDLEVADGELLVLVGPSGCGKSTALRLIAGLDSPDGGTVSIGGRDVGRVAPEDRDVAMVFQGYALYPHMTARDIMGFPLRMRGVAKAERARRVEEAAALLGIGHLLARRPGELSGGERQRVAMGRAIVRAPAAFLFDEPLSNLDAALRAELRVELAALVRRLGTTSVYVTHDQIEAMTMGDRIAVLRAGELQQVGPPRAIYEAPANTFVAGFLGTPAINLVPLERAGDRYASAALSLPAPPGAALPERVIAGVRPEHLRVAPGAQGGAGAWGDAGAAGDGARGEVEVEARVVVAEPLGAETFLYLEAGGARLRARAHGFATPAPGEAVRARLDPGAVLWFDAGSGARIAPPRGAS